MPETTTEYVVRAPYTHTPGVEDLQYPPNFETEDAALEWMAMRVTSRSNAAWELSWLLAKYAPADNEYGEQRLARACARLSMNKGTAGRWRWMGGTWDLDTIKRFDRLQHTHYQPATKVMAEAQLRKDTAKMARILDILHRANEGKEDEEWGDTTPRSVKWIKDTIQREIEGIEPVETDDGETPTMVSGHLCHELMQDGEGNWHWVTAILHPNKATAEQVKEHLSERGLLGQYVSAIIKVEVGE
jgi:hypothetical protein